ncbi:substrate-binding domain-containing protein [Ramlibacter sp. PS4R-6]|uniref:substrate-binding domain-containing protein n=1 Tax=Ramlibacter sp. PS4R-6 TaxID=3133438 RepID=UPI0030AF78F2
MTAIRGISSMATRQLLGELAAMYGKLSGVESRIESVGGVDAAKRVQADEPFDVVVLASDAIDKLQQAGKLAGSRVDLVRSGVGIAVKAGSPQPDVSSEAALKRAVLAAPTIGYSTGPSGTALLKLFERWGLADIQSKLVQASPGIPVGSLVADGKAALGFQQLSELIHQPGIELLGAMPAGAEINTVFSGAVCATSTQPAAARELLLFMASPPTADAKRRQGMEPA